MTDFSETRLERLRDNESFGGERSARGRVVREMVDEIRRLQIENEQLRRFGGVRGKDE